MHPRITSKHQEASGRVPKKPDIMSGVCNPRPPTIFETAPWCGGGGGVKGILRCPVPIFYIMPMVTNFSSLIGVLPKPFGRALMGWGRVKFALPSRCCATLFSLSLNHPIIPLRSEAPALEIPPSTLPPFFHFGLEGVSIMLTGF